MWFGLCLSVWLLAGHLAEEADLEVVDVVVGEALVRHVALARLEALALAEDAWWEGAGGLWQQVGSVRIAEEIAMGAGDRVGWREIAGWQEIVGCRAAPWFLLMDIWPGGHAKTIARDFCCLSRPCTAHLLQVLGGWKHGGRWRRGQGWGSEMGG